MKKIAALILSSIVLMGTVACTNAKTSSDAPNSPDKAGETPTADETQDAQQDAESDTRQKQLEADIRAREQRNDVTGGDADRADSDLESEVRSKLETNIPGGLLTVGSKDGAVEVSGTVETQAQLDKIEPLAKEIKGVNSVDVKVQVVPK